MTTAKPIPEMSDQEVEEELQLLFLKYSVSGFHHIDLFMDHDPSSRINRDMRDLLSLYRSIDKCSPDVLSYQQ